MRFSLPLASVIFVVVLAGPASAQMCGGTKGAMNGSGSMCGGMIKKAAATTAEGPTDKMASEPKGGMCSAGCSCCGGMTKDGHGGMDGDHKDMPGMDMPKKE